MFYDPFTDIWKSALRSMALVHSHLLVAYWSNHLFGIFLKWLIGIVIIFTMLYVFIHKCYHYARNWTSIAPTNTTKRRHKSVRRWRRTRSCRTTPAPRLQRDNTDTHAYRPPPRLQRRLMGLMFVLPAFLSRPFPEWSASLL